MSDANVQVARQVTRAIKRNALLFAPDALTQQMTAAIAVELKPLIESVEGALEDCDLAFRNGTPPHFAGGVSGKLRAGLNEVTGGAAAQRATYPEPNYAQLAGTMHRIRHWAQAARGAALAGTLAGGTHNNTLEAIEQVADAVRELCCSESRRAADRSDAT